VQREPKTHCISARQGADDQLVVGTLSLWQQQLTAPAESGTQREPGVGYWSFSQPHQNAAASSPVASTN